MDRAEWTDIQVWWNIFESIFRCGEYTDEEKAKLSEAMTDNQKRATENERYVGFLFNFLNCGTFDEAACEMFLV